MTLSEQISNNGGHLSLDSVKKAQVNQAVDHYNKSLPEVIRKTGDDLGKDDFLQILITQLQNQDPTKPMEDKEFIAQMAQFSSLEQMNNMSQNFEKMNLSLGNSQVVSLLGRNVEVLDENQNTVSGSVRAISTGDIPMVEVSGKYYPQSNITKVIQ